MTIRFADTQINSKKTTSQDFTPRRRVPLWQTLCIMFGAVLSFSLLLSIFVKDTSLFAAIIFIVVSILGAYVVITLQRSRDLMLATEFQNALLSSALSQSNEFCLIIKNDNTIAYMDKSFQEMFPSFYKESRRAIEVLLEYGQVTKEEKKRVFSALERQARSNIVFEITDNKKQTHRIIMNIEPIHRPKGFMLLLGREFVEKRIFGPQVSEISSSGSGLPIFNDYNVSMFSYITDSMDIGAYLIDLLGNITYANITLEQWLDFDEHEIIEKNLSLDDLILQESVDVFINDIKNFNGEVTLKRKVGGYVKVTLNQKALYDEQGAIIGYTALLNKIEDPEPLSPIKPQINSW